MTLSQWSSKSEVEHTRLHNTVVEIKGGHGRTPAIACMISLGITKAVKYA